jgi:CheY-like chemotaxis protein
MARLHARPIVLIAEDEELVREIIQLEFEDAGYDTLAAGTGDEAMNLLERGALPDILVTDIRMPGQLDGWALARKARAILPAVPVIYVSGFTGDDPRPVPDARFFNKPFRASAIVEAAAELIGS